jgi:putative ABC transport system substrate-binding protein
VPITIGDLKVSVLSCLNLKMQEVRVMKSHVSRNIIYTSAIVVAIAAASIIGLYPKLTAQPKLFRPVVAITQIVSHPSLDQFRKGIEDELKEQKIDCDIHFENAQGNIAIAMQIAQKFASQNPAVIVPISTPSAQTVYSAAKHQHIPVIFTAVSDPVAAKLTPSFDQAGNGITGVSDLSPIEDQVDLIREILPEAKNIGVVSNPGETNSVALLDLFEKEAKMKGMVLIKAVATSSTNVAGAIQSLVGKVDAIYIPNDNMVISALEAILKIAKDNKAPVFCADPESVGRGCLAAVAHSQYGLGRQTGKMVAKVLKGTGIQALPMEKPLIKVDLSVNKDTAKALNISLPESVLKRLKSIN